MDLSAEDQVQLALIDAQIAERRDILRTVADRDTVNRAYRQLDGLGREKSKLLGKKTIKGPGDLNKRDRRAIRRLQAGKAIPSTIPQKRFNKILKIEPTVIKTYVAVDYRSDVLDAGDYDCICCPDKRGYGHTFCHATHDLQDKGVWTNDIVREAMTKAGVEDGDEFEVIVRKTGRRPFGDTLMVNLYKDGRQCPPTMERVPGPKETS